MGEQLEAISKVGSLGWAGIAAGVVAWDLLSEETLSHAFKRGMENPHSRPFVLGALAITGAHLCSILPDKYDPYNFLARLRNLT